MLRNKINQISKSALKLSEKSLKKAKDAHFDPPKYLQSQLEKEGRFLHENDRKILSELFRNLIGESVFIRKYLDKPSQIINDFFKEEFLKPASDQILEMRKNFDRETNVENSPELVRKNLRYGLRLLSMANVYNSNESREKLAQKHCGEIINQANKILITNIENLFASSSVNFDKNDEIILSIPTFDSSSIKNQNIETIKISDEKLLELKSKIFEKLNPTKEQLERLDGIFKIHNKIVKNSEEKLENFEAEIEKTKDLQKKFSNTEIEYEYSKLRLIYASEWIARVVLLDPVSKPIIDFITNQNQISDEVGVEFVKIMTKQLLTTAIGHGINTKLSHDIYSDVFSSKKSQKTDENLNDDKKLKSGYFVFCDTEAHDYLKFAIRLGVKSLLISIHSQIESDNGILLSKEDEEKIVRSLARFVSGSHIAMRMEIKENAERAIPSPILSSQTANKLVENSITQQISP
jgi:hypothetical protein